MAAVPLPVIRCPCRRANVEHIGCGWHSVVGALGAQGLSVPKTVRISNPVLGAVKVSVAFAVFFGYAGLYCVWNKKSYLMLSGIQGVTRLQLQHPVNGCNPLHEDCLSRFKSFDKLPYCIQHDAKEGKHSEHNESEHARQLQNKRPASDIRQHKCEYLDEFDVESGFFGTTEMVVPTRKTLYKQKALCDLTVKPCHPAYKEESKETVFVADIESFTLLVDHSFACEDLVEEKTAWEMQGFVRPCGPPYECDLVPIDNKIPGSSPLGNSTLKGVRAFWNAGPPVPTTDAYSIPNGDVFRVGYLLNILNISLDDSMNFQNHSAREEGLGIVVAVHYKNYKLHTMPNTWPTIYEYRVFYAAQDTYKTTSTFREPGSKVRTITDQHGVYVRLIQQGRLGRFNIRHAIWMFVEASVVFSFIRFLVMLVAVNWWQGEPGDQLEATLVDEVQFELFDSKEGEKVTLRNRAMVAPTDSGEVQLM
eukprot:gnl/TRDRNA2_/TRDRNA2_135415_c0_seq1.p1 gnl/TRDRNA2_/TRDRNA2_135415_c0~~gnl/TRDRNA2_/TRDRNA2_135415_c0_seq1.p1  ORF type:complete len:486 (+),score=64.73 gnl/TRDRNA2_/TRDRNA2_135415_c0_seq1:33-1460(+)